MKTNRNTVIWGAFAALLLFSSCSSALTLGRMRGAAWVGKDLDLAVQVQFAVDEDPAGACFDADITYGDIPQDHSRTTVTVLQAAQPNTQIVRVQSAARVDDAVVSLLLRTTCGPKASRRYVVLSEVPSELASGAPSFAAVSGLRSAPSAPSNAESAGQAGKLATGPGGSESAGQVQSPGRKPDAQKTSSATVKPSTASAATVKGSKSRVEVSAAVLEDLQKRVDDIAKWQADSSNPEDAQKNDARAKALEAGIRDLQQLSARNQKSIQLVAAAVEDSASQNYGQTLVYLLGALLLVCLVALAWAMKRTRNAQADVQPWWRGGDDRATAAATTREMSMVASKRPVVTAPAALPAEKLQSAAAPVNAPGSQPASDSGFDAMSSTVVTEHVNTEPQPIAAITPPKPKAQRPDFAPSGHGNLRAINTREMLDVRQQADFFMALGQHDEAVRLLESSIHGSSDANPLVYLDLLKILHTLSRRADFERYREEFNLQFTGRIPEYEDFLSEGNGLEAYEDICHQIVVLWPTEYTVDFIEQCLVRLPEDDPEQGIDLEAFKDLLLLYGVLKRLDQFYDSSMAPFSASRTASSQYAAVETVLADAESAPLPTLPATMDTEAAAPAAVDIDLNLDEAGAKAPTETHGNLIDFDVSSYTDTGKPALDK